MFGQGLPPIAYLGWDESELNQIYYQVPGDQPRQLTAAEAGVYGFVTAPGGVSIIYATNARDGTSELAEVVAAGADGRRLLECPQAQCIPVAWPGDGARLVYEKRQLGENDVGGATNLWWLDVQGGNTIPVLEDEQARSTGVRFSPDGNWLSYVAPEDEAVVFYNLADGRTFSVTSEIGVPPAWSPSGKEAILPLLDVVILHGDEGDNHLQHTHDYEAATHLFAVDVESGEKANISGDRAVEDSAPAYSPDGQWVAFGRRFPGTAAGRQLWLMKADGSEQRMLLDDPDYSSGPPSWSPDGRTLLFQRFLSAGENDKPGIWLFDIETGELQEMIEEGMLPAWLGTS